MSLLQLARDLGFLWPAIAGAAMKSSALLGVVCLFALIMRGASAAGRHWLWLLGMTGALAIPLLAAALPHWQVLPAGAAIEIAGGGATALDSPRSVNTVDTTASTVGMRDYSVVRKSAVLIASNPAELNWREWTVLVWAIGAVLLLGRVLLGMGMLARLARRSHAVEDETWLDLLRQLSAQLDLSRPVRLLRSGERPMPMVWGIWRATVLLPDGTQNWPLRRRRLVLLHELAHLKRRDSIAQLLGETARVLYWFNPLVWLAVRRLGVERERACDDMVLMKGHRASDYAEELLTVAAAYRPPMLAGTAGLGMARVSTLELRMRAILDRGRRREALGRRGVCVGLMALIAMSLPLAALRARGAEAEKPAKPASTLPAPEDQRTTQPVADHRVAAETVASTQRLPTRDEIIVGALKHIVELAISEQKYGEALTRLDQILAIDPNNTYATNIRQFVEDRATIQNQIRQREAEAMGRSELLPLTTKAHAQLLPPATQPEPVALILDKVIPDANFDGTPLTEAIGFLSYSTGAKILLNRSALETAGIDVSTPITLRLHNVKGSKALSVILGNAGGQTKLGYIIDGEVVTVSTAQDLAGQNGK